MIRLSTLATSLVLATCAASAWSQSPPSLDGKWTLSWSTNNGRQVEATLEVKGSEGEFKEQRASMGSVRDPCSNVTAPVEVRRSGEEIRFRVLYANALAGCNNRVLTMKLVGPDRMEGSSGGGFAVTAKK